MFDSLLLYSNKTLSPKKITFQSDRELPKPGIAHPDDELPDPIKTVVKNTANTKSYKEIMENKNFGYNLRARVGKSGYKGIAKQPKGWLVCFYLHGLKLNLGLHKTLQEAIKVYNTKALEVYGDDAMLNKYVPPKEREFYD